MTVGVSCYGNRDVTSSWQPREQTIDNAAQAQLFRICLQTTSAPMKWNDKMRQ